MWDGIRSRIFGRIRGCCAGIAPGGFVYYTHSWRAPVSADTAAMTNYGGLFTAAVERENVMGVQFHPEKSAETGLRVLKNFLAL